MMTAWQKCPPKSLKLIKKKVISHSNKESGMAKWDLHSKISNHKPSQTKLADGGFSHWHFVTFLMQETTQKQIQGDTAI